MTNHKSQAPKTKQYQNHKSETFVVAVAGQGGPAFTTADVNLHAGLVHLAQLVHELAGALRKGGD